MKATALAIALMALPVAAAEPDLTPQEQTAMQVVIAAQCRDQLGDAAVFDAAWERAEQAGMATSSLAPLKTPGSQSSETGEANMFLPMFCGALKDELTR